jgi:hypothetical protein
MGNTFRHLAGGVDAVDSEFGNGGTASLCRPPAGRGGDDRCVPGVRHSVTACGRICLHRKKINVSTVLAGQRLGVKEVDDGIWLASFMRYDLGYFGLEQKTLQPIDNPFGTRLSPMS